VANSSKDSDRLQEASDVPTADERHGSTDGGLLPSAVVVATLDAGLARERTRQLLFGAAEVEHRIGRYTVIDQIGAGAMGVVYSAYDADLDRKIALKLMRPSKRDAGPEARERMIAEARAMAKVSHPNVVSVFEVGVTPSQPPSVFVAMEFVEGRTLRQWVVDDEPSWRQIVAAYAAAGRGLAAVHRAGLVHRDFKPENAMIDADHRVRVMDFGLARDTDETVPPITSPIDLAVRTEELTRTGELVGTPAYMSPERFNGEAAHPGSDQWAFCVSLYEALWGSRPYIADSVGRLAMTVVSATRPPDPPSSAVPRRIRAAVLRGLAADPDDRWPSMDALVTAISSRRRSAWTMLWLGLGGAALASGWLLQVPGTADTACEGAREAFADTWSAARADEVQRTFAAASPTFGARTATAVQSALDAWTDTWLVEHREACEATRVHQTQSDTMLDRRMRCLERRRRELDALVGALVGDHAPAELAGADATAVERAEDAVDGLVSPERCGDVAFLDAGTEPPSDPEVAREVEELRAVLAEIDAAHELGRNENAAERARSLYDRVEATDYEPLRAELAFAMGQLAFENSDAEGAREHLERAYFGARRAREAGTAAEAALHLASVDITFGTEFDRGEHWLRLADVEITEDVPNQQAVALADLRITLHDRRGDYDRAIAEAEDLLERMTPDCGDACEQLPEIHSTIAHLYNALSRQEEAIEHGRKAVELEEARHGEDHPHVAAALARLGDVLDSARRYEEAHQTLARALEIRERTLGPDHHNTASTRVSLGITLIGVGRMDEGIAQLERALVVMRRLGEKQILAATFNQLGYAYGEAGRHAESLAIYEESAAIMRTLYPDGHPTTALVVSNIAGEHAALGNYEAALAGFEEALAIRRKAVEGHDPQRATLLLNVARTLVKVERATEAEPLLREAIELTAAETLAFTWVAAHHTLAEVLRERDPAAADAVIAAARARCDAADAVAREAANCKRLTPAAEASRGSRG
jgi:tetratricopeptide (TPR) repeat protein/tRNA A-37 threonylcarbamoyl transferase component Bud32